MKLNVLLREQGVMCKMFYTRGGLDKAMKQVVEEQCRYAVLLGENELENSLKQMYSVKDLVTRSQEVRSLESLLKAFDKWIVCFIACVAFSVDFRTTCRIGVIPNRHKFVMSTKVTAPVGYKPIEGTCSLPEKIVNKKKNEIWLIRAPADVCTFWNDLIS